jgi:hypothetical protein
MSLEGEPYVLPQTVGDEVEVAGAGPDALGLGPLDEVLEAVEPSPDAAGPVEPDEVLGRLDEHRHLIPVVLPTVVEAVDGRTDGGLQDRASFDELSTLHPYLPSAMTVTLRPCHGSTSGSQRSRAALRPRSRACSRAIASGRTSRNV